MNRPELYDLKQHHLILLMILWARNSGLSCTCCRMLAGLHSEGSTRAGDPVPRWLARGWQLTPGLPPGMPTTASLASQAQGS